MGRTMDQEKLRTLALELAKDIKTPEDIKRF